VTGEPGEAVSISNEETFAQDVTDRAHLHAELRRMAEGLARSLERRRLVARTVTAKLRYPDFSIVTRSHTLPVATDEAEVIGDLACRLLDRALAQRPDALRLAGVGVSGLAHHKQLALPVGGP
jgi:DNA polymerase-4